MDEEVHLIRARNTNALNTDQILELVFVEFVSKSRFNMIYASPFCF